MRKETKPKSKTTRTVTLEDLPEKDLAIGQGKEVKGGGGVIIDRSVRGIQTIPGR